MGDGGGEDARGAARFINRNSMRFEWDRECFH